MQHLWMFTRLMFRMYNGVKAKCRHDLIAEIRYIGNRLRKTKEYEKFSGTLKVLLIKRLVFLCGGMSCEREVSLRSEKTALRLSKGLDI